MDVSVIELSDCELSSFAAVLGEVGRQASEFEVTACRYVPMYGATTEIVTLRGRVSGQYARRGGLWVDDFREHLRQGLYETED
jgi:hypothetical protein